MDVESGRARKLPSVQMARRWAPDICSAPASTGLGFVSGTQRPQGLCLPLLLPCPPMRLGWCQQSQIAQQLLGPQSLTSLSCTVTVTRLTRDKPVNAQWSQAQERGHRAWQGVGSRSACWGVHVEGCVGGGWRL